MLVEPRPATRTTRCGIKHYLTNAMTRPTTDPKRRSLAIRLTDEDAAALEHLAQMTDSTRGEVIRRLIRIAARQAAPAPKRRKK